MNTKAIKSVDIFPWNDHFNTGIPKIDDQHKRLVQLLNQLASHIAFRTDIPTLHSIFDQLTDYTVYHFETEESVWHQAMPDDEAELAHKQSHEAFVQEVLKLKSQLGTQANDALLDEVLSFLTRWLTVHIMEKDRSMALTKQAIDSGMSVEKAKQHAKTQMQGSARAYIDLILSIYESLSANSLSLMREISERKRIEHRYRHLFEKTGTCMGIVEKDCTFSLVNQVFADMADTTVESLIGTSLIDLLDEESRRTALRNHEARVQGIKLPATYEVNFISQKGRRGTATINATYLSDSQQTIVSLIDTTSFKEAEAQIENLTFYDPLTQLPNRRLLSDQLNKAVHSSKRNKSCTALLLFDVNNFKALNEAHNHSAGDVVLQQIATRLSNCLREEDFIARFGGDDFAVIVTGLDSDPTQASNQTEAIARKLITALTHDSYQINDVLEYESIINIGITIAHDEVDDIADLLKQAEIAMYQAKTQGNNTFQFFDSDMQANITQRVNLELALQRAISAQQFELFYQLQTNHRGQPLGAEALIRWHHPVSGLLTPFHFIALAEETGLILPIGEWVLESACQQLQKWQHNKATQGLILSLNVSAAQFHQKDFAQQVIAALNRYQLNPDRLCIELTESILIDDIDNAIALMTSLSKVGVRLSLDDFGTGYSSLQYLKQLPLYELKIDQSFIRNIVTDQNDQAIVRAIISMAASMDLSVIAEGVETTEQQQFLLTEGCRHFQGYLFSKPVPVSEFEGLLTQA